MSRNREGLCEAELHRLDAIFRCDAGEASEQAELSLHKAIEVSKSQSAKSWELRACTSLAQLWGASRQAEQARNLLAPIYAWFTEGFATKDLQDAKVLLDALSQ